MARLTERLGSYSIFGLDTSTFIYHFEEHPTYLPVTRELLSRVEEGDWMGITSTITLMEIVVKPFQLERQDVARKYEALLMNFPNLTVVDLDRDVARKAAMLRAKYRFRPPDALQLAASLIFEADVFVTNDKALKCIQEELEVIVLDDLIENP